MTRVDLHVPFEEKDEAKALGARWDGDMKRWYVPAGVDASAFERWRQPREEKPRTPPDFRASRFNEGVDELADAMTPCWSCRKATPVTALYRFADDEGEHREHVGGVVRVDAFLAEHFTVRPHFRLAYSHTTESWSFGNLCVNCGALQGDFFLHMEPDGPFFAVGDEDRVVDVRFTAMDPCGEVAVVDGDDDDEL